MIHNFLSTFIIIIYIYSVIEGLKYNKKSPFRGVYPLNSCMFMNVRECSRFYKFSPRRLELFSTNFAKIVENIFGKYNT